MHDPIVMAEGHAVEKHFHIAFDITRIQYNFLWLIERRLEIRPEIGRSYDYLIPDDHVEIERHEIED